MRIGLDFDNTLVCYHNVFAMLAERLGVHADICRLGKKAIRNAILALGDSDERQWMALQGQVYGRYMPAASLFPGVEHFFQCCQNNQVEVYIVSHKTQYGHYDEDKVNLRMAATSWMRANGFFSTMGFGLSEKNVFFLSTRSEKIQCLTRLECDVFIDDLEEVLGDKDFPQYIQRIQFNPNHNGKQHQLWPIYQDWAAITQTLFTEKANAPTMQDIQSIAAELTGDLYSQCQLCDGGGNNQLYCVSTDQKKFAMKFYDSGSRNTWDQRDRYSTEVNAIQFLQKSGEQSIATFHRGDPTRQVALYDWIDAEAILEPTMEDVEGLISFVERLRQYSKLDDAQMLPLASQACLCFNDLIQQIEFRLNRLQSLGGLYEELDTFLKCSLLPAFDRYRSKLVSDCKQFKYSIDQPIVQEQRLLSPSDFGLHNCIKTKSGKLFFVDMEYFGWDDPVKLTADTLLHPGMQLTETQYGIFRQRITEMFSSNDNFFEKRLMYSLPMYVIRWCLIMLNPYLPEKWHRMQFADASNMDQNDFCQKHLNKALRFFNKNTVD